MVDAQMLEKSIRKVKQNKTKHLEIFFFFFNLMETFAIRPVI